VANQTAAFKHATGLLGVVQDERRKQRTAMGKGIEALTDQPVVPISPLGPGINQRCRGWLKHLYNKATQVDDWTEQGRGPADWWDRSTGAPMSSFPRFDLHESSYAVALMADRTPAWREVYGTVLEGLADRYTTHWAAVDWLNQVGTDPARANYPHSWKGSLIPEQEWGQYDMPGWTANGLSTNAKGEAMGVESDPIAAEAMLFFKGWLALVMSLHGYVTGSSKYRQPWSMANRGGTSRQWTLDLVVSTLHQQWSEREEGLH